jgi:pilus assembly protein CpaB
MMNRRFLAVLGLSAILALVVSAIFYQITTAARGAPRTKMEMRNVVVATSPMPLGAVVKSSDLKIVSWPAQNVPPGTFAKIEDIVDRVALSNILVEEPVLEGRLAARGAGVGLAGTIPPGMRAVSVRVNDVISVAGFVLPGSQVDVMVTAMPRGNNATGPVTRTVLHNIRVVSAGRNIQPDAKGQPENVAVITLLVTPEQAEVLTLAANEGRLQLALRNNTDTQQSGSGGVQAAELFTGGRKAPEPAAKPRPRLVRATTPVPPVVAAPPPPPPPPRIELIRGDKKITEVIATVTTQDR